MNRIALKAGYISSVIGIATFVLYTFCFIAILVVNPIFIWTNFENYIMSVQTTNQIFKHIAMFLMIVYGVCFLIQVCSISEIAVKAKKYFAKLAELFGIGFLTLISINYFVQLTTVRMQVYTGQTDGLEQFIQANPVSGMAAINMLGWTIFFGLSCIFAGLALGNTKIEKVIKYAFLSNGVMMFLGLIGYLFDISVVVFLCMNLGMGSAILIATIPLCYLFKRSY
ncbi:MAG: hypothetical protein ACOX22_06230 [Caldicoprobacterales bacterium]|jgi:hypothetical protein